METEGWTEKWRTAWKTTDFARHFSVYRPYTVFPTVPESLAIFVRHFLVVLFQSPGIKYSSVCRDVNRDF